QGVHHDIWDRDPPAQPVLLTVKRDGRTIDAVAQTTKQGFVFVFDRVTGAPLFPIEERAYPPSTVPGEVTAPTQPLPLLPEPFARQRLTEQMLTTRTEAAHAWAVEQFRSMRSDGQFLPFSLERPTILFPGFDGGAEWGGPAVNPATGVMYVNANDLAWTGMLAEQTAAGNTGAGIYEERCSVCHGADRKGSPPAFPSLVDIAGRLSAEQIAHVIRTGSGRMPAFPSLEGEAFDALLDFLRTGEDAKTEAPSAPVATSQKYRFTGYHKFLDPDGYPAVAPPWGTLSAIDLNTGNTLWKIPLGEYPELAAQGLKNTGTENYGGPILTASGVLFIGATIFDRKLRAFDSSNSELLWETELPFAGTATPATYMIDGKQYVVIFTSNAKNRKAPQGSAYVAFSLP
ncbi:MAG TPA: c-type cytochrome, partial [Povalibacter sp.]|nr:c-type cytochrome [Povalibacter sp.]